MYNLGSRKKKHTHTHMNTNTPKKTLTQLCVCCVVTLYQHFNSDSLPLRYIQIPYEVIPPVQQQRDRYTALVRRLQQQHRHNSKGKYSCTLESRAKRILSNVGDPPPPAKNISLSIYI